MLPIIEDVNIFIKQNKSEHNHENKQINTD